MDLQAKLAERRSGLFLAAQLRVKAYDSARDKLQDSTSAGLIISQISERN